MSNLKLSEAAAAILNEDNAANILKKSISSAGKESFGLGKKITADEQGEENLGTAGHKSTDTNYDAAKSIKQASYPGANKGEPMQKLASQPGQTEGRKDLAVSPEGSEDSPETIVNRGKGKKVTQTMSTNKGAAMPCVPESEEVEDEDLIDAEEASEEEVIGDLEDLDEAAFTAKYGMGKNAAIDYMYEGCGDEEEEEGDEEEVKPSAKKAASKVEKMNKEDIDALFYGESLSEDFKEKASSIFESAVQTRVEAIAVDLEEQYKEEFQSTIEEAKNEFADRINSYLDYVVENWMEDNKLAVEKGLRSEIAEDFITALRNVFVEHYIDVPEEKVDLVEGLVEKVESLEEKLNSEINKNVEFKQQIAEHKKTEIVQSVCEGLTLSQSEKIKSIAENVEFKSTDDFVSKLSVIKESYFPANIKRATSEALNEDINFEDDTDTKVVDPVIDTYAKTISKLTKF